MTNRKPFISIKNKICIICEGFEEYEYIEKLLSLDVWNKCYEFILINAKSNGKIPAIYQDLYAKDFYDIILVFCDTDKKPYEDYETIKSKIDKIHGDNSAGNIIIFANPCTMQIILLHFADVRLISHKKFDNRKYIQSLTGIDGYKAKKAQRDRLFNQITKENYKTMIKNIVKLAINDTEISSTNFLQFINYFERDNLEWIININKKLESS
jgi:hypothetical protein